MTTTLDNSIPVTSTNLRPFTNKDLTNDIAYKHGMARPLKHYRLGIINAVTIDPSSSDVKYLTTNINRYVNSSKSTPLLSLINRPGGVFKSTSNVNFGCDLVNDPRDDQLLADCCQAEKALRRVRGASTKLDKTYYQTSQQYRHARCNTIEQKSFQYTNGGNGKYLANCGADSKKACNEVIYKPNNSQFGTQGGVSSSDRTTRLTLNTIKKEVDGQKNKATLQNYNNVYGSTNVPFILKAKSDVKLPCKKGNFSCYELEEDKDKKQWPKLVGMDRDQAITVIKTQNPSLNVVAVPENSMVTMDYRLDRVRVFYNETTNKVSYQPMLG
jgi:hypothetical protein